MCNSFSHERSTSTMNNEILVHISTPATRQNDDLYRTLADEYLIFEPCRRPGVYDEQRSSNPALTGKAKLNSAAPPLEQHERAAVGNSILSTSKDSYGSFPSHVSSEDQAGGGQHAGSGPFRESMGDGSIPTSSRLARLDHMHRHWKQTTPKATPKASFTDGHRRADIAKPAEETGTAFIEDTQLAEQALMSQLPDSYSMTSEDTSSDEDESQILLQQERPPVHDNQHVEVSIVAASITDLSAPVARSSSTGPTKSQDFVLNATIESSLPAIGAPTRPPEVILDDDEFKEAQDFSNVPSDAFPPAPKVSVERPSKLPSQITKHLAAIKAQNPKRFKFLTKLYTPKYDDRGYWSVDCSSWPEKLQHEFWTALCESVLRGRLGWGTTLFRETSSSQALGTVRFYCWAEVAEHIWLLMWLYSKGKIVGSKSKWIDADGAAVFQVP
jgi:hypothetical protein